MSFLNSVKSYCQSALRVVATAVRLVGWAIGLLLHLLIGTFQWRAPGWLQLIGRAIQSARGWVQAHRRQTFLSAGVLVVLIAAAVGGKWWYDSLPKPIEVAFRVVEPPRTRIEDKDAKPSPLVVAFSDSVAPLKLVGKDVAAGVVEMNPKLEGRWYWENDRTLKFDPKADWPVGGDFKVSLAQQGLVAEHVRLEQYGFRFKTAPFTARISQGEFYQDPSDPGMKKVVLTVTFSHPVDAVDFEKRVSMAPVGKGASLLGIVDSRVKFTVNYDKLRLNAHLHSEPLAIPVKDAELKTTVAADVRAAQGGRGTGEKLDRTVTIPGLYSLRVNDAQSTLVSNERFEPEQVLVLGLSAAVHEKEIQKSFTVYVLPVQHPDQQESERKRPYEWYDPAKIGPEILRLSQPLKLEAVPAEREYTEQHGFKYQADVGRYLYLKLGKGVKSFGGYVMGQDFDRIIRVQPFPPELKILHNGSLLAMSGERKLSVFARDIPGLRVEIGRLLPNQIQHLITQSNGAFGSPQFNSGNMDDSNITERFTQVMELPRVAQGKPQYQPIDLGGYLDTGTSRRGVFLLKVESYDPEAKRPLGKTDRRLVLVTDLGLLVKKALDGSQDVFIQSIHDGAPLSGVTVEVIGKNGLPVLSQSTDGSGHVRFPDLKEFKNEQAPVLFLARRGGDMSFLPLGRNDRQLDLSRFDVGGVANTVQPDTLSAYLFSDRGIYRPGDEMHVGVIVKAADWSRKIAGIPLEAEVVDPRGLVVKRERLRLSASGFEELRFATQETSPTGNYTFQLYIVKDDRPSSQIGAATAKVQEFLPDRMKLSARLSAEAVEGWVSPQDLKARVNLQNLFGTPAAGRRVAAMLTLSPAYPSFRSFREFTFYDPQRAKEGFNERLAQGRTDDKGEAEFDLNLQRFAAATYRLNFLAQGYEAEGGRSVSAETATLVSSLPYLVGYKPDGDFGYVTRGAKRSVEIIAIDPQAKKTAVDKLTLAHIERKFVSVLTRQDSGTYKYESRKRETVLSEKPFAIPAAGAHYLLATDEPGDYALAVRNAQGVEVSRIEYSIAGQANLTRSLEKNAELQITLNKKDYAPGEDIELQIKAPYTGAGLITIERDKVYQHTWFKSTTTSTVQKIRLPGGFEGNGYVSVAFIRDAGSEEIYMSPLSYGVAPFSVSLERRRVDVEVSVPDLVKPGEAFKIGYRTDKPTRVVVFAVDEGILQVAAYRTADPLGYFFQKRALDVKTAQILDLILPEFKRVMSLAAPGGDAEGTIGRNLNPFKRKRDKPVVFWSGILDAGPQARDITYTVPDYFNGTLRVMAVAVAEGAVGVSQKTSLVRGDFVLNPNTPMVVAPGDEFEVSVGVANNVAGSGKEPTVSVTLATSKHLEVIGPAKADVKIGEMREGAATFKVRAREQLGSANLTFTANLNGKSARISVDASVRPAVPYLTQLTVGHFKDGHQDVPVTRNMHDEYRSLQAGVSHLPLGVAYGLVTYLGNFPYSCTEQLVSQGMPAVVLGGRPEFGHVKSLKGGDLAGVIETLRTRQNAEGAYGLWAANQHVSDFASVYAQHFLLEARERNLSVPQDMLTSGNNYLNQLAASEGEGLSSERVRAYAIYLLTRQGIITTNYASALQKRLEEKYTKAWQQDLAGVYLAASYQLMKQGRLADGIIGKAKFGAGQVKGFEDYYDNLGRDAMLLYVLSKHFPRQLGDVPPEALTGMVRQIQEGSYNTLSSAYVLLALDAYVTAAGNDKSGKLEISEILKDGKARALPLPPGLMPRVDYSTEASKVRFSSDGDLTAFYVVTEAGFDRALPDKEIKSGLEVLREYTDLDGKAIAKVKLGEEIEVHLKFRAIGREQVANLAIVDLLPGGFEIVEEPRGGGEIEAPPVREPRHRRQQNDEEGNDGGDGEGDSNDQESPEAEPVRSAGDLPIGSPKSTWHPEYADVREDRIVLYGSVSSAVQEFVYRIKATNAGTYHVPPTLGESMYERTIRARSLGGTLTVERN